MEAKIDVVLKISLVEAKELKGELEYWVLGDKQDERPMTLKLFNILNSLSL